MASKAHNTRQRAYELALADLRRGVQQQRQMVAVLMERSVC